MVTEVAERGWGEERERGTKRVRRPGATGYVTQLALLCIYVIVRINY